MTTLEMLRLTVEMERRNAQRFANMRKKTYTFTYRWGAGGGRKTIAAENEQAARETFWDIMRRTRPNVLPREYEVEIG